MCDRCLEVWGSAISCGDVLGVRSLLGCVEVRSLFGGVGVRSLFGGLEGAIAVLGMWGWCDRCFEVWEVRSLEYEDYSESKYSWLTRY